MAFQRLLQASLQLGFVMFTGIWFSQLKEGNKEEHKVCGSYVEVMLQIRGTGVSI